jgi:hypothetical protein
MPAVRGILIPFDVSGETVQQYDAFVRAYFANEYPFLTRVNRMQVSSETFNIISYSPRPLTGYTLGAALADTTGTTLTLSGDQGGIASLQVGDTLLIDTELVEITGSITVTNTSTGAGTAAMRRGRGGTTAATHLDAAATQIIANSATGGEVDREAARPPRSVASNYVQTFQYATQVGGKANAITGMVRPGGQSLFETDKGVKMLEMVREMEKAFYVGTGEAPSAGGRTKTKGIKALLPASNVILASEITDEGAYTQLSLLRDLVAIPRAAGGNPDVIFAASNFMTGIATWKLDMSQVTVGETSLGLAINEVQVPLGGATLRFVEAPTLPSGTAFSLTSDEVSLAYIRQEQFINREKRGDAVEGDWIADFGVHMVNPDHHAWVEGITAFAAA